MIRMLEKEKLIIYRSQDLLDAHRERKRPIDPNSNYLQFDRKFLKIKSIQVNLAFENQCKKLKFDDNETALTFLNYRPLTSNQTEDEGID